MRRALFACLTLMALAAMSGCSPASSAIVGSVSCTTTTVPACTTTPSPLAAGQYAFVLGGNDPSKPMVIAGSITTDGKGNITAGDVDVNDNGVVSSATGLTGTIAFDTLPTGSVGLGALGTFVLPNTVGSVTHFLELGFAFNSEGTFGSIMDLSANNFIVAGTIQQQSAPALSLAGMAGSYVVALNGKTGNEPTSVLGRFTLAAGGATSALSFDRSIAGVNTAGPTAGTIVTFGGAGNDGSGRGTFTLTMNDGLTPNPTQTFAYYAVNTSRFIAAEIDANGTMMLNSSSQTAIPASADTTGSAFAMAGFDTATASGITTVGQLIISSATSGTIANDTNDNGVVNSNTALAIPADTYSATTGRGTAAVTSGVTNGFANSVVFYLTATGTGFLMDNTVGATNRAMVGPLTPQMGVGSFSNAGDLGGSSIVLGEGAAVNLAEEAFAGEFNPLSDTIVEDERYTNNGSVVTATDNTSPAVAFLSLSASSGRGTFTIGNDTYAFYVIQPNQFVFINITGTSGPSPLFIATPD